MNILITGAAGFLGSETVRQALARGHHVRAMVRRAADLDRLPAGAEGCALDLGAFDLSALADAVQGMDGVINCAAVTSTGATDAALSWRVNVEGTQRLFGAARAAGVGRWVQISSMSAHPASTSIYGRTKLAFDEFLRASTPPPAWTILRPSLIYGPGGKGLVAKTAELMKKLPAVPVVGSGEELLRPVLASDVAVAALDCLQKEGVTGKTYMIGGADEVTLNAFLAVLAQGLGLRARLIHLPIPLCFMIAKILSLLVKNPPLTVDNVLGVQQARRVEQQAAEADLGYRPAGLAEGLRRTFAPGN